MTREQLAESGLGVDDGATPGFYPKLLPDGREIVGIHDQNDGTFKLLYKIGKLSDYDTQNNTPSFSMGKFPPKSRKSKIKRRKGGKKTINKKKSKAKTIKKKRRNK